MCNEKFLIEAASFVSLLWLYAKNVLTVRQGLSTGEVATEGW